jgi:hypothetical protein
LRAEDRRLDFVGRQHQRRHVEAFFQHITGARLAPDRHALADQGGDVPVDRALGGFSSGNGFGGQRFSRRSTWMIWNSRSARRILRSPGCC